MFIREHSFLPRQWIIHKAAVWRPCVFCQDFLSWNRSVVEILSDPRHLLQLGGFKGACNSFWQMALKRYSPSLLWRHISSPLWASDCYFLLSALHVRTRFITEMAFWQFLIHNGELRFKGSPIYLAYEGILWRKPLKEGCPSILAFKASQSKNTLMGKSGDYQPNVVKTAKKSHNPSIFAPLSGFRQCKLCDWSD